MSLRDFHNKCVWKWRCNFCIVYVFAVGCNACWFNAWAQILFIHCTVGSGWAQGSARWIMPWCSKNICSPKSGSPISPQELRGATVGFHTHCLILTGFSSPSSPMYWYIFIKYYVYSISICWIGLCKCVLADSIKMILPGEKLSNHIVGLIYTPHKEC